MPTCLECGKIIQEGKEYCLPCELEMEEVENLTFEKFSKKIKSKIKET
jgi:hypothetical protein